MNRVAIAWLAVAVASGLIVTAQEATVAATVRAVDASWRRAYVACDAATWDALLADELTFIHNNGSIDDKAKQMASVQGCGIDHWTAR